MPGSATPLGYCDKTDVENLLLTTIDSSFNTQVNDWISAAEKMVNTYTGYTTASGILNEAIVDEVGEGMIDSEANLMLFPRKVPLNSISSLQLVKGSDSLTISLTNGNGDPKYNIPTHKKYLLYPDYELTITGSSIISSFGDIRNNKFFYKISYIAGFTEVPANIRLATTNFVADVVMRHSNKEALAAITQGKVSKRWQERKDGHSDFYLDAIELLNPYRMSHRWM